MSGSGCQLKKSQAFPSAVAALCVRLMAKCMPAQALAPMWQALKHGQSWIGPGEKSLQEQRSLQRDQRAGSVLLGNAFQMQE